MNFNVSLLYYIVSLKQTNMKKVSIIGAGNVGATAAMNIARMNLASTLVLLDIKDGVAEGKAMDISQCARSLKFNTKVFGVTNDYTATADSDVIVITSGVPRKPGMTREDLVGINSSIMTNVVTECNKYSPNAIYVVVSNPMDTMSYMVYKILKKLGRTDADKKVFGMGGMLDSSRFAYFIQTSLRKHDIDANIDDIDAWVIGGHGDSTMIPLIDFAKYKGKDVVSLLTPDEAAEVVSNTMKGGATLTGLLGTSAWEAPGACIAYTVGAITTGEQKVMPCSVYFKEIDCYIGMLAVIGSNGVENIFVPVDKDVLDKFQASITAVKHVNEALPEI